LAFGVGGGDASDMTDDSPVHRYAPL
jgi:hypothetical protein